MSWPERLPMARGRLLLAEPLGPFTWFRVGGPADVLFLPADEADLATFLAALDPGVPYESRWAPYDRVHGPGQGQFPKGSIRPRGYYGS